VDSGRVVMGLITWRYIARKNEIISFPPIQAKSDWGIIKPSLAQHIVLEGVRARTPVYLTPYLLGGIGRSFVLNDTQEGYRMLTEPSRSVGLDLKYSLSSNLTLDVTTNTDIAQVEADDEQINLTRFSLFFPEKRQFFQERSSIFDFSMGGESRLFYSRRIGIAETTAVPINGGLRLIGRSGDWDLGLLDMQTKRSGALPSENLGVVRIRRRVLNENSYVGGMVTTRAGGEYNHVYGFDGSVHVQGDDYCTFSWSHVLRRGSFHLGGLQLLNSGRFFTQSERRTNRGLGYIGSVIWSGPDYDPGLGFCDREDFTRFQAYVSYGWYPDKDSPVTNQLVYLDGKVFLRNSDRSIESLALRPEWWFNLKSGASGEIAINLAREDLRERFSLTPAVSIPPGTYGSANVAAAYQSPPGWALRGRAAIEAGQFYDGTRVSLGFFQRGTCRRILSSALTTRWTW